MTFISTIKSNPTATTEGMIRLLNPKIRGWANYFKHVVAKETFSYIDNEIFLTLRSWMRRKHLNKSWKWRKRKYFRSNGMRNWVFSTKVKDKNGNIEYLDLFRASSVEIQRHIKIKAKANPFDPEFAEYFQKRKFKSTYIK